MQSASTSVSARRVAAFAVIALALIASALIPRGYMIAPSSTHLFSISACPQTNPIARMAAHGEGDEQHHAHASMGDEMDSGHGAPSNGQSGGDCPFAGFAAQGLKPDDETKHERLLLHSSPEKLPYQERAEPRLPRLRPPLRAPPFSA